MSDNSSSTQQHCSNSGVGFIISMAIAATRIVLLLPLCSLVLYLGYQQWRQQRSFKAASHANMFTYHIAAMELIWILGCLAFFCGLFANLKMVQVGYFATSLVLHGQILFHSLTCVERYLAVVHPITYLRLKNVRGVWIRNVSIWCIWLLSFGCGSVTALTESYLSTIPLICLLVASLIVVSFCSLSIIRVLVRPGPGDGGGVKQRVDQSKQRAFHTVGTIMGVLSLWFVGLLVGFALNSSPQVSHSVGCVVLICAGWFNLPSSLLLPLLYLQRAGKLSC